MGRRKLPPAVKRDNKLRRDRQAAASRRDSKRHGRDDYIDVLVLHPRRLADVLVATGFLRDEDRDNWPSVTEALNRHLSMSDCRQMYSFDDRTHLPREEPAEARIRITERLRARLSRFWGADDPRSRLSDVVNRAAATYVYQLYAIFCFDPPAIPCDCRYAMPQCDCVKRFGSKFYRGHTRGRHNGRPIGHIDGVTSMKDGRVVAAPGYHQIEAPKDTDENK
jgi:hypothetical protein